MTAVLMRFVYQHGFLYVQRVENEEITKSWEKCGAPLHVDMFAEKMYYIVV